MLHSAIPLWREARIPFERAALRRDPVVQGQGVPRGDGEPVLLIPGFLAGDLSLGTMAHWLRRLGYRPCRAGIRANIDCTEKALGRLEAQLEAHAERHGRPVSVIGHSRGGVMGRILAVRRPDLVHGLVTLGSPLTDQLDVHPLVRAQVEAVALLGTFGVGGLFTRACALGECCGQAREDSLAPFPPGVPFTSIFSRSDGVVNWYTCLDPAATLLEVRSSHCGMAFNPAVYTAIGRVLAPSTPARRRRSTVRAVTGPAALAA